MSISRNGIVTVVVGILTLLLAGTSLANPTWLPVSSDDLPRWRGFNLQAKFHKDWSNGPFLEKDFQLIHELGFNFIRLPMDYRVWIKDGDWRAIDEDVIREIDQAIAWGEQYGIHVCINFHRAPGHTVASPKEATSLWSDPETQEVCALHWAYFARRYKDIPSERLSFNLFNEPTLLSCQVYTPVVKKMVEAIRAEDPDRLIIADGVLWGRQPCPELVDLGVAQATRGYEPFNITHYKATWVDNTRMEKPAWPALRTTRFLYGPEKGELHAPLQLEIEPMQGATLRIRVGTVSRESHLVVLGDGNPLWEHTFVCGDGEGEWQEVIWKEKWGVYQNRYDRDYRIEIPPGIRTIELRNVQGDWMTVDKLAFKTDELDQEVSLELSDDWEGTNPVIRMVDRGGHYRFESDDMKNREWLWEEQVAPWLDIEKRGSGVMVGEWGAFNKTPHDITLRWMEDCLQNWQKAGWGWALWGFRGSFGILDSEREDVDYENWRGHKLDRAMLELLQRY